MKRLIAGLLAAISLLAARPVKADQVFGTTLANEVGLSYNNTYTLDTTLTSASNFTTQVLYTSATFNSSSFTNGAASTGTLTVSATTALVAAAATGTISVSANTGLLGSGCGIAVGGLPTIYPSFVFYEGRDWSVGAAATNTADSITAALLKTPYFASAVNTSGSIALTALVNGNLYNSVAFHANCGGSVTVPSTLMGGADNASVFVNGTELRQGRDWSQNSSANTTASHIASAINSNSSLSVILTASASSAVVSVTSKRNGVVPFKNFSLRSTSSNIAVVAMSGAADPAFPYNAGGTKLHLPSHGFTTALPLLYTEGGSSPVLSGLSSGTTYYAVILDSDDIALADTSGHAQGGINLATIAANTLSDLGGNQSYTLAPLAIAGTPAFKWQQSADNSSYSDISGTSVTVSSYSNPPAEQDLTFNSGNFTMRYLRLTVTAPTAGGLFLNAKVQGFFP